MNISDILIYTASQIVIPSYGHSGVHYEIILSLLLLPTFLVHGPTMLRFNVYNDIYLFVCNLAMVIDIYRVQVLR